MKPLIDWPYPDRPKLQQLRMTWQDVRRQGVRKEFRRLPVRDRVLIVMVGAAASLLSFALSWTLAGWLG